MSNIEGEQKTVQYMIQLYCRKKHGCKSLCEQCTKLSDYALKRLEKCVFGDTKPACKNCTVHCYNPLMRQQIREVMRFSGPRMLVYYPIDYIIHAFKKQATQ